MSQIQLFFYLIFLFFCCVCNSLNFTIYTLNFLIIPELSNYTKIICKWSKYFQIYQNYSIKLKKFNFIWIIMIKLDFPNYLFTINTGIAYILRLNIDIRGIHLLKEKKRKILINWQLFFILAKLSFWAQDFDQFYRYKTLVYGLGSLILPKTF